MKLLAVAFATYLFAAPILGLSQTTRYDAERALPATPAPIKNILAARPFTLETPYPYTWSKERFMVSTGVLIVLEVDPGIRRSARHAGTGALRGQCSGTATEPRQRLRSRHRHCAGQHRSHQCTYLVRFAGSAGAHHGKYGRIRACTCRKGRYTRIPGSEGLPVSRIRRSSRRILRHCCAMSPPNSSLSTRRRKMNLRSLGAYPQRRRRRRTSLINNNRLSDMSTRHGEVQL